MTTRLALLDLVARLELDKKQSSALWRLAGFDNGAPSQLPRRVQLGLTLGGASCVGLGLIFWIAANWNLFSRTQHFCLLQLMVLIPCAAAAISERGRAALSMFALTATGGVFAYFGQTYQTGADTWELFSTWAALTLPLAFCARSDAVWSAWVIIALTGLALWSRADAGFSPYMNAAACRVHIIAASCAASLPLSLSKIPRHYTGAGNWAIGIATVLTTILVASTAISDVEGSPSPYYFFCLFLGGTTAAVLANGRPFDVFSASVVGLGLNVILFAGLMKLLVSGASANNELGILLVLGVMAALMLGASVKLIVKLSRASTAHGERA